MTIRRKNFSEVPSNEIPTDTEYRRCNFAMLAPDTSGADPVGHKLFPGDNTPRTFFECNFTNREPPPGAICVRCNTAIVERDTLIDTDTIVVDGVTVSTVQNLGATVYGRYNPDTKQYEYKDPYEVIPYV